MFSSAKKFTLIAQDWLVSERVLDKRTSSITLELR